MIILSIVLVLLLGISIALNIVLYEKPRYQLLSHREVINDMMRQCLKSGVSCRNEDDDMEIIKFNNGVIFAQRAGTMNCHLRFEVNRGVWFFSYSDLTGDIQDVLYKVYIEYL